MDLFDTATIELYQGARPGEILGLHKDNVDLANKEFTIWFSTDEGKSKNAHRTLNMTKTDLPAIRLENGVERRVAFPFRPLTLLAQILGHADLEMLMRYVHPSKGDRAAAMAAFSDSFPDAAELESLLVDYHVEQAVEEVAAMARLLMVDHPSLVDAHSALKRGM